MRHLAVKVGTTTDQGLYNKPSAAVHPGALAAGTLPNNVTNLLGPLDQRIVDRCRIDLSNGSKSVDAFPHFKLSTKTFSLSVHSFVSVEHLDEGQSPEAKYS
jgi:hypothetical protein